MNGILNYDNGNIFEGKTNFKNQIKAKLIYKEKLYHWKKFSLINYF